MIKKDGDGNMVLQKITLGKARELADLSQEDAAKKIGVSVYTLSNWERGKFFPKVTMLDKIAEVYGIPKDMIVFVGEDE